MVKADDSSEIKKLLENLKDIDNPSLEAHIPLIIAAICTDIEWLKSLYKRLDKRTWTILSGIIVVVFIQVLMLLIGYYF